MAAPSRRGDPERRTRPGGRSARVNEAILTAVLDELVESGYSKLSFDKVATRAQVHRATLYRRWATKEELVAEALLAQTGQAVPMPDTGSLREDLRLLTHAIVANISAPDGQSLLRTLVSDAGQVPEISVAGRAFWSKRFALAGAIVRRGIERGELPAGTDPDFFIERLIAPLFLRLLVTAEPIDAAYADRIVDTLLGTDGT
ncbi:TetR/AcrR family transcriptional regulator [Nonomuraea indica]|uniref:TetR/AcrR family transcriptional regulator n=1 Tax=Nonomuraea indica TaxID=1581193 RepID=UPI000C79669C|nr:TetR/AcrR family transcriptional regulator [Nonomuraea indica]